MQVVSVFLTAGSLGIRNASLYIGSNSSSVFGNTLVAVSRLHRSYPLQQLML
jgi:hypothetical protein